MQIFFQSAGCLYFLYSFLWCTKCSSLHEVQLIYFFFVACVWSIVSKNLLPNLEVVKINSYYFCSVSPLIMNYFIFFMSDKDLFCLYFFKILFSELKILDWQLFSPPVFRYDDVSLTLIVFDKKSFTLFLFLLQNI